MEIIIFPHSDVVAVKLDKSTIAVSLSVLVVALIDIAVAIFIHVSTDAVSLAFLVMLAKEFSFLLTDEIWTIINTFHEADLQEREWPHLLPHLKRLIWQAEWLFLELLDHLFGN